MIAGSLRGLGARRSSKPTGSTPSWCSATSRSTREKGTLRGMHFQATPHAEAKLVRCTRGAIYDVALDLRQRLCDVQMLDRGSSQRGKPPDALHPGGMRARVSDSEDDTEVFYQMSEFYHPESARGVRWDDPAFQIVWPEKVEVISERDRTYGISKAENELAEETGRERLGLNWARTARLCRQDVSDLPEHHRDGIRQTLDMIKEHIPIADFRSPQRNACLRLDCSKGMEHSGRLYSDTRWEARRGFSGLQSACVELQHANAPDNAVVRTEAASVLSA